LTKKINNTALETGEIKILGAKVHNLKNIDVTIPRNQLTVITGLSGSGKSSLAFDTIYAEGQRRYMETLSAYARQFLGNMERPGAANPRWHSIQSMPKDSDGTWKPFPLMQGSSLATWKGPM